MLEIRSASVSLARYNQRARCCPKRTRYAFTVGAANALHKPQTHQNLALQALGRYRQAGNILEELFLELNNQPDSVIKVVALRSLGDIQLHLGEINASLETLQQSYEMAQKIKSNPEIAETLLSLGNLKRIQGNQARSRLQSTTNFAKTTPLLYISKEISPQVIELYQQAAQNYQKTVAISTSPAIKVKAQLNLLSVLIELQEFVNAKNLYSQLQFTIGKLPVSQISINARINLAQNLLFLKQTSPNNAPEWQDIAQILDTAIKQAEVLEDVRSQSYAMGVLGSVYLQTKNIADAQKLTKKAVDLALGIEAKDIAYLWQWQLGYSSKSIVLRSILTMPIITVDYRERR